MPCRNKFYPLCKFRKAFRANENPLIVIRRPQVKCQLVQHIRDRSDIINKLEAALDLSLSHCRSEKNQNVNSRIEVAGEFNDML